MYDETEEKYSRLKNYIRTQQSVAVAFSGGKDSALLLKTAHDILGDQAFAITMNLCSFPERELFEAMEFCQKEKIRHIVIDKNELQIPDFSDNPPYRCYICKKELFQEMLQIAKENGNATLLEGSNMEDENDYRPGMKAIKELGIESPLKTAGLYEKEIRILSHRLSLPTWEKPSMACLSSRIPYGEKITKQKLAQIERSEQVLMKLGFQEVRVRFQNNLARIELAPEEIRLAVEDNIRTQIVAELKKLGFSYVTIDLQGYRTGSMNEVLGEWEND